MVKKKFPFSWSGCCKHILYEVQGLRHEQKFQNTACAVPKWNHIWRSGKTTGKISHADVRETGYRRKMMHCSCCWFCICFLMKWSLPGNLCPFHPMIRTSTTPSIFSIFHKYIIIPSLAYNEKYTQILEKDEIQVIIALQNKTDSLCVSSICQKDRQ